MPSRRWVSTDITHLLCSKDSARYAALCLSAQIAGPDRVDRNFLRTIHILLNGNPGSRAGGTAFRLPLAARAREQKVPLIDLNGGAVENDGIEDRACLPIVVQCDVDEVVFQRRVAGVGDGAFEVTVAKAFVLTQAEKFRSEIVYWEQATKRTGNLRRRKRRV